MKYKKTTLKNGLRIITVPMPQNPTVTVLVMVETGSKYETKPQNGLSHFLEHMCFKGTLARPKPTDISLELDGIGSAYNAFTAQEFTGYYAKADAKHRSKVLEIVSDIYLNSTLPEDELEKEKGVIVEEINMYEDLPQRQVQDIFMEALFGDQPAGWNIAGAKTNVCSFKRDDFVNYRENHYVASATTVIVSGHFNEKEIISEVKKRFSDISSNAKADKLAVVEKQQKPTLKVRQKITDQMHLVLGVRTFPATDKRNPALKLLSVILGAGMSSRLFVKLREEMGVCYYVRAETDSYTDHGHLMVSAGIDKNRLDEVVKALLVEFKKFKNELVPDAELKKAKDYLIGTMFLGLESSDEIGEFYGYQEILKKKIKKPDEIAEEVQKVSAAEIKAVAEEIFQNNRLNLAVVGEVKNETRLSSILSL